MATIRVTGIEQLIETVPHLLGFEPEESLVVVPLSPGPPVARIDLTPDPASSRDLEDQLVTVYTKHCQPHHQLAIACFTTDGNDAARVGSHLRDRLRVQGVDVQVALWVSSTTWTDIDSGQVGHRSSHARSLMDAEFTVTGHRAPAASRDGIVARLVGDHAPLAALIPAAQRASVEGGPHADRAWALDRITNFERNGHRPSDPDAARLLVAINDTATRDQLLMRVDRTNARTHAALWGDLTARAPDDVRAPAATLMGLSSWLAGDGATAWAAYDQVPDPHSYPLAGLLSQVLTEAVPPSAWTTTPGTDGRGPGGTGDPTVPRQVGRSNEAPPAGPSSAPDRTRPSAPPI